MGYMGGSPHVALPWTQPVRARWQAVERAVTETEIRDSAALEAVIMSYNLQHRGKSTWEFSVLHRLFSEKPDLAAYFFSSVFPGMVRLLLSSPTSLPGHLPLLAAGRASSVTLDRHQVSVILVNGFFCTWQDRNEKETNLPNANFNILYGRSELVSKARPGREEACLQKLLCLVSYFSQVVVSPPSGPVTFSRLVLDSSPDWASSSRHLSSIHLMATGDITTSQGHLQVDFANKFVGGGVLRSGMGQEEVRFITWPELMASRLLTEALGDQEALVVTGAEQFSLHTGFGDSFQFKGDVLAGTDTRGGRTNIVAMDAVKYSPEAEDQFTFSQVQRELNKAFVAFHSKNEGDLEAVATGNWGCGAFGGDPHLKLVIQLLAASEAGRDLQYYTFGDEELVKEGRELFVNNRPGATVGELYTTVKFFCDMTGTEKTGEKLFQHLRGKH